MNDYRIKSLLVIIFMLLISCERNVKKEAGETGKENGQNPLLELSTAQFEQNKMKLGSLEEMVFHNKIKVTGMIDVPPQNKAVVSIPVGGYVKHTTLLVGDKVRKGQVLISLENPEFIKLQQQYLEVKARLKYLEAEYNRHQKLYKENITSEKNFLRSEADFRTAEATHQSLKQQLRLLHISPEEVEMGQLTAQTRIYAPIDGSISKMNITKGAFISPASEIMEIINTDHIHLELSVFEKDIAKVKEGQSILFAIPEASEEQYKGKVHRVGSSIDENRRIVVHGHIENPDHFGFLKGMFVSAEINTDSVSHKALPQTGVVENEDLFFVLKLIDKSADNYILEAVEVNVYRTESGYAAIDSVKNFDAEDQFLIRGAFGLLQRN